MAWEGPSGGQVVGGLRRQETSMQAATAGADEVLTRGREEDSEREGRRCGLGQHSIKQQGRGATDENMTSPNAPSPLPSLATHGTSGKGPCLGFSFGAQLCVFCGLTSQPPSFVGFQASVTRLLFIPKADSHWQLKKRMNQKVKESMGHFFPNLLLLG